MKRAVLLVVFAVLAGCQSKPVGDLPVGDLSALKTSEWIPVRRVDAFAEHYIAQKLYPLPRSVACRMRNEAAEVKFTYVLTRQVARYHYAWSYGGEGKAPYDLRKEKYFEPGFRTYECSSYGFYYGVQVNR